MDGKQGRTTVHKRIYIQGVVVLSMILCTGVFSCWADEFTEGDSGYTGNVVGDINYDGDGVYSGNGCTYHAPETDVTGNDYEADMGGGRSEGSTSTTTSTRKESSKNIASEEHWVNGSQTGTTTVYTDGTSKKDVDFTDSGAKGTYYYTNTSGNTGCLAGKYCAGDWVNNPIEIPVTSVVEKDGEKTTTTFTGDQITEINKEYTTDNGVIHIDNWNYLGCTNFASVEDCAGKSTEFSLKYKDSSVGDDGLHITVKDSEGKSITFDFTDSGTKKYKQTITDEDGKEKVIETTVKATRSIEEKTYFLGYDWHIENLDDRSSDLFGGGKSFTTPMPKATKGGRDKGGLYSVGKGVFKYTLNHFGNHTVTVTPWFDVDRYEVWYTESCNDPGGCTTTRHERYLDSRLESRDPKVYSVPVPLICDGCDGYKFCVGDGCADDCLNTIDLLCDEENAPEFIIENHTQLVR